MSPDKLAYMGDQIGKFIIGQGHDRAVTGVAEHLTKFWDRCTRDTIAIATAAKPAKAI